MRSTLALVVFSHLRWNFVFQRPQHLMSRMAARRRVVFIEEPVYQAGGTPRWEREQPASGVLVCRARIPVGGCAFGDRQLPLLAPLLTQLLVEEKITDYLAWFYTPMAIPLANHLAPRSIIYDCMDELSGFRNPPAQLLEREAELLARADLVFTGGPSLFQSKKHRNPHVHCFPSSVDAAHFQQACRGIDEAVDQAELPHPRLGYVGVIDERLDLRLLDSLAQARPQWQFILIGPTAKIDARDLPRHRNVHYLGPQSYAQLPSYLTGWEVCLLPFALNAATRYISPTKTLEYMATERPIVSTPITDVAQPYGQIVYLGEDAARFLAACEQALQASPAERATRVAGMRAILARTSWETTVRAMETLIDALPSRPAATAAVPPVLKAGAQVGPETLKDARLPQLGGTVGSHNGRKAAAPTERAVTTNRSAAGHAASQPASQPAAGRTATASPSPLPVVVVGAGPTGLSAAYHLGSDALLLEQHDTVGGWCRSLQQDGFTFDFAGHIMFSNDAYVHELYSQLLGDNVHWQDREAWIYSKQTFTRYPFQGALYGLPPDVIKECLVGAIEARFGSLRPEGEAPGAGTHSAANASLSGGGNGQGHGSESDAGHNAAGRHGAACPPGKIEDCCGDGILESTAALGNRSPVTPHASGPRNFEEFIDQVWGKGIGKHFAHPYNRKLWAVPLSEMETSWLGGRVPLPDLEEMIEGALRPVPRPMGPNARFGYPLRGGFQSLMNGFLPLLQCPLWLQTRVQAVSPMRHLLTFDDGSSIRYDQLISTMPLPVLIRLMGAEVPEAVARAAAGLRHVSVRCVHLGIGRPNLTEKHWIYYPEETVFHRIFVQGNASPHCNPPGGFGLTCEITYAPQKPLPCEGDDLVQRCIEDCQQVGLFRADDPIWTAAQCDLPYAYVVYDHARPENVRIIREWLDDQDILLAGRYSEWEYYNSDHAFLAGKKAAERVRERQQRSRSAARQETQAEV